MTLLEVLTSAARYLAEHKIESSRLNAEHLIAHVLSKSRLDLYLEFDRPLSESERAPLRELVRKRGKGIPLQHLLGTAEFYGRSFLCDSRALIPRPETEQLLELALAELPSDRPLSLLDIGTGSGVIATTLALELPMASLYATDLSQKALSLAAENIERHGVNKVVQLELADLFPKSGLHYDAIVTNLPYIPSGDITTLSLEVQHDPLQALDGGPDGLDLFRRFIASAPEYLQPEGQIWMEIGDQQSNTLVNLLNENNFYEVRVFNDYNNIPRFITAKR